MVGARVRDKVLVGGLVAALVVVAGVVGFTVWRSVDSDGDDPLAGVTMPPTPTRTSAPSNMDAEPALVGV